jgi:hypothetical protein
VPSAGRLARPKVSRRGGERRFTLRLEHKAALDLARHPVHQPDPGPASDTGLLDRGGDRLYELTPAEAIGAASPSNTNTR